MTRARGSGKTGRVNKDGAGRRSHRPTAETASPSSCSAPWEHLSDGVAAAIGIATPTLQQHYQEEITFGRARKLREVLVLLLQAGRKGNVAALKHLEARLVVAGRRDAANHPDEDPAPKPRVGKKSSRQPRRREPASAAIGVTDLGAGKPN